MRLGQDERFMMEALGARVMSITSDHKQIAQALIRETIRTAETISERPDHWYCDQLNRHDGMQGYVPLDEEIWQQCEGRIDALDHAVGTAHCIHGVTRSLWAHDPQVAIVAVQPAESAVLSRGPSGSDKIEGIGIGFVPPPGGGNL